MLYEFMNIKLEAGVCGEALVHDKSLSFLFALASIKWRWRIFQPKSMADGAVVR